MYTETDLVELLWKARVRACKRGIDPKAEGASSAMAKIAVELMEEDLMRKLAEKAAREEQERAAQLEQYYRRNPFMHPDNWVAVVWPDKRMHFYRKDLGPSAEVAEALATGAARLVASSKDAVLQPTGKKSKSRVRPNGRRGANG